MNRNYLIAAVRRAAEGLGYAFFSGPDPVLAGRVNSFPAVWLSPPRLTERRGKSECRSNYKANIYFLTENIGPAQQDELWGILQRDAESMADTLEAEEHIQRVYNVKCTPNKLPLTKNGEAGLAAEFDIEMFYCV
jgi:hypothetical protein